MLQCLNTVSSYMYVHMFKSQIDEHWARKSGRALDMVRVPTLLYITHVHCVDLGFGSSGFINARVKE